MIQILPPIGAFVAYLIGALIGFVLSFIVLVLYAFLAGVMGWHATSKEIPIREIQDGTRLVVGSLFAIGGFLLVVGACQGSGEGAGKGFWRHVVRLALGVAALGMIFSLLPKTFLDGSVEHVIAKEGTSSWVATYYQSKFTFLVFIAFGAPIGFLYGLFLRDPYCEKCGKFLADETEVFTVERQPPVAMLDLLRRGIFPSKERLAKHSLQSGMAIEPEPHTLILKHMCCPICGDGALSATVKFIPPLSQNEAALMFYSEIWNRGEIEAGKRQKGAFKKPEQEPFVAAEPLPSSVAGSTSPVNPALPQKMPIKIVCGCGQHYTFDVEPVGGRMPTSVQCPSCGADGTAAANGIIAKSVAS